jgi:hypothetical protein
MIRHDKSKINGSHNTSDVCSSVGTCGTYGVAFGEFEGGKLKGRRDYWDYAALAKQLAGELK